MSLWGQPLQRECSKDLRLSSYTSRNEVRMNLMLENAIADLNEDQSEEVIELLSMPSLKGSDIQTNVTILSVSLTYLKFEA